MSMSKEYNREAYEYYQQCSRELMDATSREELFSTWHSFDFDKLTQYYTDSLIQERDVHEEKFRKPSRKFHSDWELANFCHGGDLDED